MWFAHTTKWIPPVVAESFFSFELEVKSNVNIFVQINHAKTGYIHIDENRQKSINLEFATDHFTKPGSMDHPLLSKGTCKCSSVNVIIQVW